MSTNECGLMNLKTLEILPLEKDLIKDGENLTNGTIIGTENTVNIIVQSKSGLISILELIFSFEKSKIILRKVKEIDSKTIGFLKFSLNWVEYKIKEKEEFSAIQNHSIEKASVVYPNYYENAFIIYLYSEDKFERQIPFSKNQVDKYF